MPVIHGLLRHLVFVPLALTLLAFPAAVSADRPTQFSDHSIGFDCFIQQDSQVGFTGANVSVDFGGSAYFELGEEVVIDDEPFFATLLFGFTDAVDLTDDGTTATLSATIDVFTASDDPEGEPEPAGQVVLDATLTPDGEPIVITPTREGNRRIRSEGTIQPMLVSGSATLPDGATIDLAVSDCSGQRTDIEVWETNPRAFVIHREETFVECFWETADGFAFFFANASDDFGTFAESGLIRFGEEGDESGLLTDFSQPQDVSLSTTHVSATLPMIAFPSGEPAGNAVAEATLAPSNGAERFGIISQYFRETIVAQPLDANGTLTFPTGEMFQLDPSSCRAADLRLKSKTNPARIGRGQARPPANDDPSGAVALTKKAHNQQTAGAAFEPEAEVSCAPMASTVWFRVEGTGRQMTIDTAGSRFDTVVAVYVEEGGELVEIACVDDVQTGTIGFSWQSAVTWDSEAGQAYWIQIGGFEGEYGLLKVELR